MKTFINILIVLSVTFSLLYAQDSEYKEMVTRGFELFHDRKFDQAKDILKKAVKLNPVEIDAYLLLGEISRAGKDWQSAKNWYAELIKLKANHIEAIYQSGIAEREDGVGRDPVMRAIMWRNSRRHFETVILLDSTYKQVYYEFALLKRYQNNFEEALELCLKQLDLKPDTRDAQVGVFTFYDLFITYATPGFQSMFKNQQEWLISWLQSRSGPYDQFFLGEKYRRLNQFQKADSIYRGLEYRRLPFSKAPLYLAQTRLYYQTNQPELAEKTYFRAINSISSNTDINFIFEDVKYILVDSDLRTQFSSLDDIKNYYRSIWIKKNPLSSMTVNARLAEHYRRLIEAEKNYRFDGFRLPIHNPDRTHTLEFPAIFYNNSKFNHKGLVYLRFGEPDDKALQAGSDISSNESWLYRETSQHPKLIFHFEVHDQGPNDDWRLVPVPTSRRMLESRLGWDRRLDQYYMADNPTDMNAIAVEIQMESVKNVRRAMMSERHTWDRGLKPLTLFTSAARLLNEQGESTLEVYIAMPRGDLFSRSASPDTSLIEIGVALHDTTLNPLYKDQHRLRIARNDDHLFYNDTYIDLFKSKSVASKYYLTSHAKDMQEQRLGGNRQLLELHPLNSKTLSVSDLIVAYSINPSAEANKFIKHGMEVIPNPSKRFNKSDLVYFYFEIYNLDMVDGLARYKIEQTVRILEESKNVFQKFMGLFRALRRPTISISREHQNKGPVAYEYTAVDFSQFYAGRSEIRIKISDLNSGKTTETKTQFELL